METNKIQLMGPYSIMDDSEYCQNQIKVLNEIVDIIQEADEIKKSLKDVDGASDEVWGTYTDVSETQTAWNEIHQSLSEKLGERNKELLMSSTLKIIEAQATKDTTQAFIYSLIFRFYNDRKY